MRANWRGWATASWACTLDRRATLPHVEEITAAIRDAGSEPVFFNVNAADAEKRKQVIAQIRARLDGSQGQPGTVRVLLHSLGVRHAEAVRQY